MKTKAFGFYTPLTLTLPLRVRGIFYPGFERYVFSWEELTC
jgi:hypothetical protein